MKLFNCYIALLSCFLFNVAVKAQGEDCSSATTVTNVVNYCSSSAQFTNRFSTASSFSLPTCWPGSATADVWFRFTAVGTDVQIAINGGTYGTIKSPNIVLYSGSCSGTLTQLVCVAASGTSPNATSLYKGALTVGTVYLIRIGTTSTNRGTFQLCVSNYTPTVFPSADCDGAVKLCDRTVVYVPGLSGPGIKDEVKSGTCLYPIKESNSSWFKWTCDVAGTLTFDIKPVNPTNDLDFILYELPGTNACSYSGYHIRCTGASCINATGSVGLNTTSTDITEPRGCDNTSKTDGYLQYVNMVAGKSYALMVDNFSSSSGFTITFGGTGLFKGPKAVITTTGSLSTCTSEKITFDGTKSTNYNQLDWIFNGSTPATATGTGPYTNTYNTVGTYTIFLKATDITCNSGNSIDSVKVNIGAAATIANAGTVKKVCGTTTTFDGNNPTAGTGKWTLLSGTGTIANSAVYNSTVSNLGIGKNLFQWTISNPPCNTTTDTVTIIGVASPTISNAGANQIICGGTTAMLVADKPAIGTGIWTLASGTGTITNPASYNSSVTSLGIGNNVFKWTVSNNPCTASESTVVIKRVTPPVIDTTNMVVKQASCTVSDGAITQISVTGSSALTYSWNGVTTPTADITNVPAGGYTLVATDADLCASTIGPISIVNPNAPNKPVIVSGGNVCVGDSIKVWVQSPIVGVTYTWTGPSGTSLGTGNQIFINKAALNANGNYSATGSILGCSGSTGSAMVIVNQLPIADITATWVICPGTTSTLSAMGSVPGGTATIQNYQWLFNGVSIPAASASTYNATKPGNYSVVVTNSNGCKDTSIVNALTFNNPPVIDATNVTVLQTNCKIPTGAIKGIQVTGTPLLVYNWYLTPSTLVLSSIATADIDTISVGNYYLIATDGNGCKDTSLTYIIKNFPTPKAPGVLNNVKYCEGDAISPIVANGNGGIYNWYSDAALKNLLFTGSTYTPTFTVTDTLFLTETSNGCESFSDTVIVIINPLPVVNAGTDQYIKCNIPTVTLNGSGSSSAGFTYNWTPLLGIFSGVNSFSPVVNKGGVYTLTIKNTVTGCLKTDDVLVKQDSVPTASFTATPLTGDAPLLVNFTNTSKNAFFSNWAFGDGNSAILLNSANTYLNPGTYAVLLEVMDSLSCKSQATLQIVVTEKLWYSVPNVFTPNGDGKNDTFTILSSGISTLNCEIFDRWGLKLYTWNQKHGGWDGRTQSGSPVTEGVYFYILKMEDLAGNPIVKKGELYLFR